MLYIAKSHTVWYDDSATFYRGEKRWLEVFLQSYGYDDNGNEVTFIAFSPEHLLDLMKEHNLKKVTCCTSEFEELPITFETFTLEEVEAWIERRKHE